MSTYASILAGSPIYFTFTLFFVIQKSESYIKLSHPAPHSITYLKLHDYELRTSVPENHTLCVHERITNCF